MTKIHAEIGVLPIGTPSTSLGKYIANDLKSLKTINGIRYSVSMMETII